MWRAMRPTIASSLSKGTSISQRTRRRPIRTPRRDARTRVDGHLGPDVDTERRLTNGVGGIVPNNERVGVESRDSTNPKAKGERGWRGNTAMVLPLDPLSPSDRGSQEGGAKRERGG